jgi:hypothetical protein
MSQDDLGKTEISLVLRRLVSSRLGQDEPRQDVRSYWDLDCLDWLIGIVVTP